MQSGRRAEHFPGRDPRHNVSCWTYFTHWCQVELLCQPMVSSWSQLERFSIHCPHELPPPRGQRNVAAYEPRDLSFFFSVPPCPSHLWSGWQRNGLDNSTHIPSDPTGKTSSWTFWATRSSSQPAFNSRSRIINITCQI